MQLFMAVAIGASKNLRSVAGALHSDQARRFIVSRFNCKDVIFFVCSEGKTMKETFSVDCLYSASGVLHDFLFAEGWHFESISVLVTTLISDLGGRRGQDSFLGQQGKGSCLLFPFAALSFSSKWNIPLRFEFRVR